MWVERVRLGGRTLNNLHLEALNESFQSELHSASVSTSFCSKVESVVELMVLMHLVSSANKRAVADWTESGRSLIKIMNKSGFLNVNFKNIKMNPVQ